MNIKTMAARLTIDLFKSDYIDREPPEKAELPKGPFKLAGDKRVCSLLIFVPRNMFSTLINDSTGGYGYSHLAIDCGEIDVPSGKRVMIESTMGVGVHISCQDEYGDRNFVRIPLEKIVLDVSGFCDCLHSKLGEKFDHEEALTNGLIDDPAKQICSDLATNCLPEPVRAAIARSFEAGLLRARSAVHEYRGPDDALRLFVSPNGFAEYFGAPRGKHLEGPDQLWEPVLLTQVIPPAQPVQR